MRTEMRPPYGIQSPNHHVTVRMTVPHGGVAHLPCPVRQLGNKTVSLSFTRLLIINRTRLGWQRVAGGGLFLSLCHADKSPALASVRKGSEDGKRGEAPGQTKSLIKGDVIRLVGTSCDEYMREFSNLPDASRSSAVSPDNNSDCCFVRSGKLNSRQFFLPSTYFISATLNLFSVLFSLSPRLRRRFVRRQLGNLEFSSPLSIQTPRRHVLEYILLRVNREFTR